MQALEDHTGFAPSDVLIVAHRGCHGRFPENSLGAIAACAEEGAQLAEVDVQVTADGELVLIHDKTPAGLTNSMKAAPVTELTVNELKGLWLVQKPGDGSSTPFKIPTLVEAIEVAAACGIVLVIDPKQPNLERRVFEAVERAKGWDHVVSGGRNFRPDSLSRLATHAAQAREPPAKIRAAVRVSHAALSQVCAKLEATGPRCNATKTPDRPPVDVAVWLASPDAKGDFTFQCDLRAAGRGAAVDFVWENGEYAIRDPDKVAEIVGNASSNRSRAKLALSPSSSSSTSSGGNRRRHVLKPCASSRLHELPCFGSHLYIPLLRASCARFAVTDMPSALRAALLAFDMAPQSASASSIAAGRHVPHSWPLDAPKLAAHPSIAHQLPPSPKCLDLVSDEATDYPHFGTGSDEATAAAHPNAAIYNEMAHLLGHSLW
ncbi:hypothetical protein CTAYLR_005913 [Chrysophaeum taylorii]|uniref:GP-PDE domain-containing protein n=1 Tax=Chrysophaeum taylorii TaxID=2483200 RepID=A0AAD7UDB0_9STRA|nr:hypothetical protein CTAYLR_005913 [Chrysophaeum taylorii]